MTKLSSIFILILMTWSCKKTTIVFNGMANDNLELPLLLNLNGKSCVFDEQIGILKYSITEDDLEDFSPFVEFQAYSIIKFNGQDLTNQSVNKFEDLKLNEAYPITFITGDETNTFTLLFTSIPMIQIITIDPITNGPKTLSRMILNYPEKEKMSKTNWIGIENRGKTSLSYDKKSFGIEIYQDKIADTKIDQSYFDFESNQKWILDAMFVDISKLRNRTSFELWNLMNEPIDQNGISSKFVEVFINHRSQGLYSFTENYTEKFLDLNSQSVLYKGTDNSKVTKFNDLPEKEPNSAYWTNWEQSFPNPSEAIVWDDFEELSTLIVNGSNTEFKNNIGQLIDIDNIIDYFLFINLCGGSDNVGKNWFFLKRDNSTKFTILPWDLDGTWGRNPFAEETSFSNTVTNNLFIRLQNTNPNNYNSRLKERWIELRSFEFSENNLTNLFSTNFNTLNSFDIIDSENLRWETTISLEHEAAYITNWITNRLIFLDELFD